MPATATNPFSNVPMGPADPILGLNALFAADTNPEKVSLVVGIYGGDDGKPFVLKVVEEAKKRIMHMDHEYAPIQGNQFFIDSAARLAFGADANALKEKRVASVQALSGTGALRVAGAFIARFAANRNIYVAKPTWPNHHGVFRDSGLTVHTYTYYNPKTITLDFEGMCADLEKLDAGSWVVLHACAHNPTGIDPTHEQWGKILEIVTRKQLNPVMDNAYQGFASGDLDLDGYAQRLFSSKCPTFILCQSFAKNMGLYGERTGCLHMVTPNADLTPIIISQLKLIIRCMNSSPPLFGARVAAEVFKDPSLFQQWLGELKEMAGRVKSVRQAFVAELKSLGSTKDWSHITSQIGMMAYTGLSVEQVHALRNQHSIYLTDDGRMAISALNTGNYKKVAAAFHTVTKTHVRCAL